MRRYVAAGIWLALTIAATGMVWAAVSVVAADVTDRPAPVVAHRQVVVALQAGSSTTSTTAVGVPGSVPNPVTAPTTPLTTPANRGHGPTTTTVAPPPVTSPPVTLSPPSPTTSAPPPVHVPATTPPTTTGGGGTATYATTGGVVQVACTNFNSIRLVSAQPADGFQAVIVSGGLAFVDVSFVAGASNYAVAAACVFGQPFSFTNHRPGT